MSLVLRENGEEWRERARARACVYVCVCGGERKDPSVRGREREIDSDTGHGREQWTK